MLPIFILVMRLWRRLLVPIPMRTLTRRLLLYLAAIPLTWQRYRRLEQMHATGGAHPEGASASDSAGSCSRSEVAFALRDPRVVEIRPGEQKR